MESSEPEASSFPSWKKTTLQTLREWPLRTRCSEPEATSQRRTVESEEPEASVFPFAEKATLKTL